MFKKKKKKKKNPRHSGEGMSVSFMYHTDYDIGVSEKP